MALHFFQEIKQKHGRPDLIPPPSLLPCFRGYLGDLPEPLRRQQPALDFLPMELPHSGINIEAIEKKLILRALRKFDWNQTHAARFLDLSRKTLIYRGATPRR